MKHTQGPWKAEWDDNGQWYIEPLGITGHALRGDSGECVESANAHLIAAAPDLLEALNVVRGKLNCLLNEGRDTFSIEDDEMIQSAIAKAEGQQEAR